MEVTTWGYLLKMVWITQYLRFCENQRHFDVISGLLVKSRSRSLRGLRSDNGINVKILEMQRQVWNPNVLT